MHTIAYVVFSHYWEVLCVVAALGQVIVLTSLGWLPATWGAVGAGLLGTFTLNRLAAAAYEREDAGAPIRHRAGGIVLAAGLVTAGGAAGIVVATLACALLTHAGGLTAEASMLTPVRMGSDPLLRLVTTLGMLGGMGLMLHGYLRGHRRLVVTRFEITLPHLPAALDGLRVVHLSDLHLGPLAHRGALRDALDRATAEAPDLVVVTGDIADSPATDLSSWLPELARVRARHGVVAILGNHDERVGLDRVAAALRAHTTWRVLRDEIALLEIDGARLAVVGVEHRRSPFEGDAVPALAAALPPATPTLLLGHHPNVFPAAVRAGFPLILAGHTHGGQLALPGLPRVNAARVLMTRYDAGTFVAGSSAMYVNRGLGVSGQRLRVGVPREITVVTLRAPAF